MGVRFDNLLNEVDVYDRPAQARRIDITNVTDRIDEVVVGSLFCCVVGSQRDGHDLAATAVERGAVALVVERELPMDIPQARVNDVRAALAPLAATFYGHPDRQLRIVGITGTNGKTTTTQLLASIMNLHHWKTGSIGTLSGAFTSPPAPILQRMLAEMRDTGYHAVVMEVSSHALVQHRADSIRFRAAVFTNLTQDHLDYHGTMNAYFEAKAMLFDPGRSERGVVNVDDPWGRQLVERMAIPVVPYSLDDVTGLQIAPTGSRFVWNDEEIVLPLVGKFNVYNALAAAATAKSLGVALPHIASALSSSQPVPGRVERIDHGQPFTVLVDFAHTPDGLQNVLDVARHAAEQRHGRVIALFGCGGDRDAGKRPQMGVIAEELADAVVVTSDNPRSEDPSVIVEQILSGMLRSDKATVELDRQKAIDLAISLAQPGDVVVIAGRGHETHQEVKGTKLPFDDRVMAGEALERLRDRLTTGGTTPIIAGGAT